MAPRRNLLRLFSSIAAANWAEAKEAARDIAEFERKQGHHALAEQLRNTLDTQSATVLQGEMFNRGAEGATAPLNALSALHAPVALDGVSLPNGIRASLRSLVIEHQHVQQVIAKGLRPRRRILLHGPPGCGKSMTARALATELGLPVFVVRLDAIVGAYLGQTATRVRELFRFSETVRCVLLIDEIDALGRARGNERDIGELDRVAISLMQELEHSEPRGLIVATSNVATALDRALMRRFDVVLEFEQPTAKQLMLFAQEEATARGVRLLEASRRAVTRSKSYANALRIVADLQRESLLRGMRK